MILLPRYRRRQPSGPLEIDRSNPITRGLSTVYLPTVRYPGIDLVTRVFDTAATRGVLLPSTNGVAYSTTTASNWSISFAPVGIPASYPALSIFTLFEQYDTTTTGPIFGGGNSSTNYARFFKENTGAISFVPNTNSAGSGITGPVLNTNQVYALAAIHQGNERELFVDAASVASANTSITFLNGAYNFAGSQFPAAGNQRRVGIYCGYVWTRRLTLSEIKSLTDNPWQIFRPQRLIFPVETGGGAQTLSADPGSYALTGSNADLLRGRFISADAGSYALTGSNADLLRGRFISADAGSYALTGSAATLSPSVLRPDSDITTTNWTASAGTVLYNMIDEAVPDDNDYIISPDLTASPGPAVFGLNGTLPSGSIQIQFRAKRSYSSGQIRVVLQDSSGNDIGTSSWQTLTSSFMTYTLSVNTSGAVARARIEVQT
jgi:hypothetical protein